MAPFYQESLGQKFGGCQEPDGESSDYSISIPQMCRPSHSTQLPGRVLQPASSFYVKSSIPRIICSLQSRSYPRPIHNGGEMKEGLSQQISEIQNQNVDVISEKSLTQCTKYRWCGGNIYVASKHIDMNTSGTPPSLTRPSGSRDVSHGIHTAWQATCWSPCPRGSSPSPPSTWTKVSN